MSRQSASTTPPIFRGGGRERSLSIRRHPRARDLRLRVDPRDGRVLLTMPPRVSARTAFVWAESRRPWVERALAELPPAQPIEPGGSIPFRGGALAIDWDSALPRSVRREGDRLRFGGPVEAVPAHVIAWLKREALRVLEAETRAMAAATAIEVGRIGVGDARARWGSCSAKRDIRYSWRLILAPPAVLTAVVAHELAHCVHLNHGADFHALVTHLFGGDPAPERRWLRAHGASLYSLGRMS